MRRIAAMLSGACFSASAVAAPAWAQAQAQPAEGNTISEVVVTTQRRSERLRDVPISVVSQTGDQLAKAGVTNVKELSFLVPGVKIDQTSNYVQPAIRGISSGVVGPSTDAPVAIYLDGVVQPNQIANHFDFADIDRIEVAKGPQGTLFGRNATGGAISIFTKAPSFTPTGNLSVGYGNLNHVTAKGYVSGPLVGDVLAGSLSGYYEKHDGYDYDIARKLRTKGLNSKAVRGKLLFQPTDWAKLTFIASYQDRFDSDTATGIAPLRNTAASLDPAAIIATKPHTISFDTDSFLHLKQTTATIRGEFDLGFGKLTTISGYSKVWAHLAYDADRSNSSLVHVAYSYPQPEIMYSQELSFASNKIGPFSYVVGAYYYYDDNKFAANRVQTSIDPATDFIATSVNPQLAYAGFAEANYDITDRLTVIGGVRYSWERRANKGKVGFGVQPSLTAPYMIGPAIDFHAWTPRASVKYRLTDDTNVYFTFSKGFKSGGVQSTAFLSPPAAWPGLIYQPEKITAYEVGLKSAPLPNLSFNVAGYYYDYTNLQVQVQTITGLSETQNAATAKIYGLDADGVWRATNDLTFSAGVSLLHARYEQFPNAVVLRPAPPLPSGGLQGNVSVVVDASGNVLPRAPDYTFSLVTDYTKDVGPGTFGANLSLFYTDTVYFDSDQRVHQGPYGLANARVSFKPRGSNFRVEAWVKNLTDKDYISSTFIQNVADVVGYGPQRTYGVSLDYTF
ncbi:TonB-dependent receptor [Phenylobacterium sp.]|jgi:iron complex outermembrane receptor protein|uniref:TonB-dependent receptor n=1 Tax=Phenylobacterium sp. TaxID=1871053 RepID=UPI002F411938